MSLICHRNGYECLQCFNSHYEDGRVVTRTSYVRIRKLTRADKPGPFSKAVAIMGALERDGRTDHWLYERAREMAIQHMGGR